MKAHENVNCMHSCAAARGCSAGSYVSGAENAAMVMAAFLFALVVILPIMILGC